LAKAGQLPDLADRTVVLVGIGYTAAPQASLDEARRTRLVDLWSRIARQAGASSVVVSSAPNTGPAAPGVPAVTAVPVPPVLSVHPGCNTQAVFADDGAVGFVADSTQFRDPAAARGALVEFGHWLAQNTTAHAHVVGSVAHYGSDDTNGLSLSRAQRVRDELVAIGAKAAQVDAVGAGWGPFPTRDAPPGQPYDERNRRVVVDLTCT
jgi:outer membrane protein OmpA-like peptidoglycan-associated protein